MSLSIDEIYRRCEQSQAASWARREAEEIKHDTTLIAMAIIAFAIVLVISGILWL